MCGIHATISSNPPRSLGTDLERRLRNRGPDHLATAEVRLQDGDEQLFLTLTSTVLSLRGDHVAKQPLIDEATGSVLCWNGEAWKIQGKDFSGNDTEAVFEWLLSASSARTGSSEDTILDALRVIIGPFAFIYFDKPAKRLYYGRDRLGRRSLLSSTGDHLMLSSVAGSISQDWVEVEADGCYTLDLEVKKSLLPIVPTCHAWEKDETLISSIGVFNTALPGDEIDKSTGGKAVEQLVSVLTQSMQQRIWNIPFPPNANQDDARVAVLFSGGLDCSVLASIASDLASPNESIDLINVAFENPRIASHNKECSREQLYELCPDRATGRKAFAELLSTHPSRHWRFVAVNVPYEETCAHREEIISLMYPHNTEMDLSIASALYFAARGQGLAQVATGSDAQPYCTTARVLLSGLGADELFGGYGRHGVAFNKGGYAALVDELKLDIGRLGKRNLGRDDRVMAHWGREVRFPYLAEDLVKWAMGLPVWDKCDFGVPSTEALHGLDPEKRVLRMMAYEAGLHSIAKEKKRAIQFGARTAKMESGRVKGTASISV